MKYTQCIKSICTIQGIILKWKPMGTKFDFRRGDQQRFWGPSPVLPSYFSLSPLDCKEIQPVHSEGDQPWDFFGRNDAKAETPVLWPPDAKSWKRLWCWQGLGAGGEGVDWGWDGWMASLTRWTWVWVNSRSWCWTCRPGVLRFMGSQRFGHDWVTKLNWTTVYCWWTFFPSLVGFYDQWDCGHSCIPRLLFSFQTVILLFLLVWCSLP